MFAKSSARDIALGIGTRSVTFTPAAGGSNECDCTLQVVDSEAVALPGFHNLMVWLSDSPAGEGLTATTASGTVTAKASSGAVIGTLTAKMALLVQTLKDGSFVLEITDSAKTDFYVCAAFLDEPKAPIVSAILETADYG